MTAAIRVSVPAKLILFGEWAVLDGRPAVGVALDARFHAALEPSAGSLAFIACEQGRELARSPDPYFDWAARVAANVAAAHREPWPAGTITLDRGWPLAEGLGSSSASFLALETLARARLGRALPTLADWPELRARLRELQGGRGSGFDLGIALAGGCSRLESDTLAPVTLAMPPELRLIHTGEKFETDRLIREGRGPDANGRRVLGDACARFLDDGDWLRAMHLSYFAIEEAGLVPKAIAKARTSWLASELIDELKTCGAGGGDTLLALVRPGEEAALEREVAAKGWWISRHGFGAPGPCQNETRHGESPT